ncbi:MAG: hypothetical protein KBG77_13355 [Dermatophilaceae bacterium]|nr:hypothetical protein [Dermatophilaceae bacterium]
MIATSVGPAVALIQSERIVAERQGGKAWDAAGIRAVLLTADGPTEDVMRAFLVAAHDPALHAPTIEALRIRWQRPPSQAPAPRGVGCHVHPDQVMPCPTCRHEAETAEPVAEGFVADLIATLPRPANRAAPRIPQADTARLDHLRGQLQEAKP